MIETGKKLLKWTSTLEIGITEIDHQHKTLVDLLNGLDKAMKLGHAGDHIGELINGLGNYIIHHFNTEESYMVKTKYPGIEEHKSIHRGFVGKVLEFDKKFKEGNVLLTGDIMHFLRDWVRDHIAETDQHMGTHLRQFYASKSSNE